MLIAPSPADPFLAIGEEAERGAFGAVREDAEVHAPSLARAAGLRPGQQNRHGFLIVATEPSSLVMDTLKCSLYACA